MEIGIQFYTLRDFCKDLDSFSETLKRVADIGYKNVQISGTCEYDAEWLKGELDKNGLKCVLTHIPADKLIKFTENVAADHTVFGCKNVGLGWYGFNEEKENFDNFFKTYLPIADKLYENGKYFMYHNHATEFIKRDSKAILQHMHVIIMLAQSPEAIRHTVYGADNVFILVKWSVLRGTALDLFPEFLCKLSTGGCIVIGIYRPLFLTGEIKCHVADFDVPIT